MPGWRPGCGNGERQGAVRGAGAVGGKGHDETYQREVQMKAAVFLLLASAAFAGRGESVERIFRPERFHRGNTNCQRMQDIDDAAWVWAPDADRWAATGFVETRPTNLSAVASDFWRFRCPFSSDGAPFELDVSADERFVLYLDGRELARGPDRGLPNHWHYQSYRVTPSAGEHVLEAVVWQLGDHAPIAQLSVRGGFILKASGKYDALLTTGRAPWKVAPLVNTRMTDRGDSGAFGVGSQCAVRGTCFAEERPDESAYVAAVEVRKPVKTFGGLIVQGWMLFPSPLPDQLMTPTRPGTVRQGLDLLRPKTTVPARQKVSAWWDLGAYRCAYPRLRVSGGRGATIKWRWVESLRDSRGEKGDRAAWKGKSCQKSFADTFCPDGRSGGLFTTPWWRAGRWCVLEIETGDEALAVDDVSLVETHYPLAVEAAFACSDPSLADIGEICLRGLKMCLHETYMDCPFYEQQMYPGDGRVQFLVTEAVSRDSRAVRNALGLFDFNRRENGMIGMSCPSRGTQESATYTMCWVLALADYAWLQNDREFVRARFPGMVQTMLNLELYAGPDGLLHAPPGWNFTDWVPGLSGWLDSDGRDGRPISLVNLLYLNALRAAVRVCEALDERALAARYGQRARELSEAVVRTFWEESRGLLADDVDRRSFSEHAQCLAILGDALPADRLARCAKGLLEDPSLARATVYFSHYLFDAYFELGRSDAFLRRMDFWRACLKMHLTTPLEKNDANARSDCHAWGSHPLHHFHRGLAGVRPTAPFFAKVAIAPQPGPLSWYRSKTPHPAGFIEQDLRFESGEAKGTVTLPIGLEGTFEWNGRRQPLKPGRNAIETMARGVCPLPSQPTAS